MTEIAPSQLPATNAVGTRRWRRYAITLATVVVGALASIAALMMLIGPYGPLPMSLPFERPPMIQSQRLAFPSIVRSGKFDAFVIGSSTSRVIGTDWIDARLGVHSANVGINGATQHEQRLMAGLIARQVPNLRLLIWGLDSNWCAEKVEAVGHPQQPPSEWLYDDIWWNDLPHLINTRALETAAAMVRYHLGSGKPRYPANGFLIETPPEDTYDQAKARAQILAGVKTATKAPMGPGIEPTGLDADRSPSFPALRWIDEILAMMPPNTLRIMVLMPPHAAVLPERGSSEEARMRACKRALTGIARRNRTTLVDYYFASPLTLREDAYWDALHFRRAQAAEFTRQIVQTASDGSSNAWSQVLYRHPHSTAR